MRRMSDERYATIIETAWAGFEGDCGVFQSAAGALAFGRLVGWQAVRVTMSAATFRKYEKVLGIRFRDELPDRIAPEAERVRGIELADKFGKFWQALSAGLIPAQEGKIAVREV
jgi:hypothetical protein